jgi:hypothetical protein
MSRNLFGISTTKTQKHKQNKGLLCLRVLVVNPLVVYELFIPVVLLILGFSVEFNFL